VELKELLQKIAQMRKEPQFQTNAFLLPGRLEELLSVPFSQVEVGDHHVAVLAWERRFYRLYYYLSRPDESKGDLRRSLSQHSDAPIVADLVNKPQAIPFSAAILSEIGFRRIETLIRMHLNMDRTMNRPICSEAERAAEPDAREIEELLYQTFNVYVSRLPDRNEIRDLIRYEWIWVIRDGNRIAGLALFKPLPGRQVLLDQLLVRPGFRGRGLGEKLLQTGIARLCAGKQVFLWAHTAVVPFYEKYGFEQEERADCILLFEEEKGRGEN
jgi:N-acetylglutamate synthase-like GNAT family acetyltransferase